MHLAKITARVGATAFVRVNSTHEAHITKPTIPSRHLFRARRSHSHHRIVVRSAHFHEHSSVNQCEGGGGGRGGVKDYFDRWWRNWDGGSSSGARLPVICLLLSCQALEAQASPRRNRSSRRLRSSVWDNDPESNNYATHMTDLAWPILQNLGFSGAVGVVCAIALKAIGRVVAIGLGTAFAIVQLLAYGGFITVEWSKIHEDILRICDVDQDGSFGASNFHDASGSLLAMLSQGLPSVSAFCLGFGLGFRL